MKNFIFKSEADFHKILFNQLKIILNEQKHQRMDLADIKRVLHMIRTDSATQKQVEDFYETSPQTDSEEQDKDLE